MRVGVLIITHGGAGAAMLTHVRALVGPAAVEGFGAVEVRLGETRTEVNKRLEEARERLDDGSGVLVVCDLYGSTPSNAAHDLPGNITVLTGVNLPMLVKLASLDRHDVDPLQLAQQALDTAVKSIRLVPGGSADEAR